MSLQMIQRPLMTADEQKTNTAQGKFYSCKNLLLLHAYQEAVVSQMGHYL